MPAHPTATLRLAITGHRDLSADGIPELESRISSVLDVLVARLGPANLELVTAMADGADQLVTEVARTHGCRLHVVLPKPLEKYRAELSDESRVRLDALVADADVRVATLVAPGYSGTRQPPDEDESAPYRRLGDYLARSAHIVLALWDGDDARRPGGTLDVLASFLDSASAGSSGSRLPPRIEQQVTSQAGVAPTAIWIRTARNAAVAAQPTVTYLTGSDVAGIWFASDEMPEQVANLLDDMSSLARAAADLAVSSGDTMSAQLPDGLDPDVVAALDEIDHAYATADRLAIKFQSRSNRALTAASLIAAGMGFCFLWFAKIDDHLLWLYAYLALFLVGYATFRAARSGDWLRFHLSSRALAETLRVRYFTTLLGIADRVDLGRMLELSGVSGFPGFTVVVAADRMGVPAEAPPDDRPIAHAELVQRLWVDDQAAYFERRAHEFHRQHERLEFIQRSLYALSFLAVAVIIVFGADLKKVDLFDLTSAKTFIVFLMGLLPLWLTFWELHQGRLATVELRWQFRNQADIFRRASAELTYARDAEERATVFVDLAERSLFETYLWTLHRYHRQFTPPSGG